MIVSPVIVINANMAAAKNADKISLRLNGSLVFSA